MILSRMNSWTFKAVMTTKSPMQNSNHHSRLFQVAPKLSEDDKWAVHVKSTKCLTL